MKLLRTLSTGSLVVLAAAVAIAAAGGTAIAIAAGGSGPAPPTKPLPQALHDALAAPEPEGITARIKFTNSLLPSGALEGRVGSALMSGASGRLWLRNDGRGRLELQSTAGDVQIVWNGRKVTVFDASSNTVYRATLPARKATDRTDKGSTERTTPSLAKVGEFLSQLGKHAGISGAQPSNVASRPAYSVTVSPKENGGLLGSLQLAWDAARGVPLRVAIYARGARKPALALEATSIRFGPVPASNVDISPPAGAKSVDLGQGTAPAQKDQRNGKHHGSQVTGLRAVKAAAGFPITAPDRLAGLERSEVRLVGAADSKTALIVYGDGLGSIVVVERPAGSHSGQRFGGLPEVSLDGVKGQELATPLGTAVEWQRGKVTYVLAGSVPSVAAEAAARSLK